LSIPSGIVLIDKPPGITSFQALKTIKTRLNTGKVGHTGTLDRFASGLLIACVGSFTKLSSYITGMNKEYDALFYFGQETDTLDPEGKIVREMPVPDINSIQPLADTFIGTIKQKPPAFSAVHVAGKRAYNLARKGTDVDLPEREVNIQSIEITDWTPPELHCTVVCSKGTYIRSLARDMGRAAGSCAYTKALRRTKIGAFSVSRAVDIESFVGEQTLVTGRKCFELLPMIDIVEAKPESIPLIAVGKPLDTSFFVSPPRHDGLWAVFDGPDTFIALIYKNGAHFKYEFVVSCS